MPSKSPAQARLMRAAAHGWKKPGGGGPSVEVGKEFMRADEKKHAHKSREGREDRKRELDKWAHGQRNTYVAPET
jgi:hypothetical protein